MVWKFVGTTYVALIILVALHLFSPPPPFPPFPLSSIATLSETNSGLKTAVHSTRAVASVSFIL